MTQHYFYTDPLAAAWMAKHHGMKCRVEDKGDTEYQWVDMRNVSCYFVMEEAAYYIHPDSLHLLEPKVGDLILKEGFNDPMLVKDIIAGDVLCKIGWDGSIERCTDKGYCKIIQRNGIPFMWPESDASDGITLSLRPRS
jgi:hypothetical protein